MRKKLRTQLGAQRGLGAQPSNSSRLGFSLLIELIVVVHHQLGVDLADELEDYADDDDHSGAGDEKLDCADG